MTHPCRTIYSRYLLRHTLALSQSDLCQPPTAVNPLQTKRKVCQLTFISARSGFASCQCVSWTVIIAAGLWLLTKIYIYKNTSLQQTVCVGRMPGWGLDGIPCWWHPLPLPSSPSFIMTCGPDEEKFLLRFDTSRVLCFSLTICWVASHSSLQSDCQSCYWVSWSFSFQELKAAVITVSSAAQCLGESSRGSIK